jgi:DNA-directed RNA polymerase specialized sigma24 family protein
VDAWLQWFATEKQATCRVYLCTRYHLNTLDAEALINTALLQVWRHWATITQPHAYFWQTLKQAIAKQEQRRRRERRQLAAYAQQCRLQAPGADHPTQQVEDLLERIPPRQYRLLVWFAQGYTDAEVAAWLQTTPPAVRVARHRLLRTLRASLGPTDGDHPRQPGGKNFFSLV